MIAAPIDASVLLTVSLLRCLSNRRGNDQNTYTFLVLTSKIKDPNDPRLAESNRSKSFIFLSFSPCFRNQSHFSCPSASAVGSNRADFANPEKIEIKALIEIPIFHLGSGFPSYLESTIAIIDMHMAPKNQLMISISHHSTNHLVNHVLA